MEIKSIEQWKENMLECIKINIHKNEQLAPVALLLFKRGDTFIHETIPQNYGNPRQKQVSTDLLRDICKLLSPVAIILTSEAFMQIKEKDDNSELMPCEDPSSTEVLIFQFESLTETKIEIYKIIGEHPGRSIELHSSHIPDDFQYSRFLNIINK